MGDITLLIDRSGSMHSLGDSVVRGTQKFLDEQRSGTSAPGSTRIKIVTFDNTSQTMTGFDGALLEDAPADVDTSFLVPRGSTRLIDTAMEELMAQQDRRRAKMHKEEHAEYKCIFALLTDGDDNQSTKYTAGQLRSYMRELEDEGNLTSFFLASNQDAATSGERLGFATERSMTFSGTRAHTFRSMSCLSTNVSQTMRGCHDGSFSRAQRATSFRGYSSSRRYPDGPSGGQGGGGHEEWSNERRRSREELKRRQPTVASTSSLAIATSTPPAATVYANGTSSNVEVAVPVATVVAEVVTGRGEPRLSLFGRVLRVGARSFLRHRSDAARRVFAA